MLLLYLMCFIFSAENDCPTNLLNENCLFFRGACLSLDRGSKLRGLICCREVIVIAPIPGLCVLCSNSSSDMDDRTSSESTLKSRFWYN